LVSRKASILVYILVRRKSADEGHLEESEIKREGKKFFFLVFFNSRRFKIEKIKPNI
jgi:hypothetical protein